MYDCAGKTYVRPTNELDTDGLPLETFIDDDHNDDDDGVSKKTCSKTKKRTKARVIRSVWFNKEVELEKHCHELITLFTPWQNEETDLLGIFSSYKDHCMALSNAIYEQLKEYAVCNEDFDEIQDMNILEESYDSIAPSTQNIEPQDLAEGNQDLHPDFKENYNLSDDIGIPSADSNTEPLILNELPDDEYRHMVEMLNKEQKEFFYHVLYLIDI